MEEASAIIAARRCIGAIVATFDYERKELNPKKMKELKSVVRDNPSIIPELVDVLFQYLRRENCDRRLAAVLICDQLFQRSHAFRVELTNSLQDWLVYTAETDLIHYPLPLPKEAANALKVGTLKIVKAWHDKFSSAYPKLANAYQFLRASKAFDFERADAQLQIEREREEEAERRREQRGMHVVEEVGKELSERLEDITRCLSEARSAIHLLMPKFEDDFDDEPGPSARTTSQKALHAYTTTDTISIIVPVEAPAIEINETNESIVSSLLDSSKMLRFYNKLVLKWLAKLTKYAGRSGGEVVKQAVDLKTQIGIELQRCDELRLPKMKGRRRKESGSESDDFEDVPEKEGLELDFKLPDDALAPHEIERIRQLESGEGPGPSSGNGFNKSESSEDLQEQKSTVPILSFGLDLKYWGKNVEPAEVPRNNSDCHRFWRPSDESDATASDGIEAYQSRVITFVGPEERPTRQCRAPLLDGTVCPRRDRYRCPVHGPIVDRDSMGFPRHELPESNRQPLPQNDGDAEYMRDVERAVGVSLSNESAGSSKRRRQKGVIKKRESSEGEKVRSRLSAKLFDRRSIKRISETLDAMQKARAAKNFEQQFNYALSRT